MAISGKKIMFLGVFMAVLTAVLLVVATEGAVTVYNPARIPVDILVDGESLRMDSEFMSMDVTQEEQKFDFTTLAGVTISIDMKNGGIIILLPEAFVDIAPAVRVVPVPGDFDLAGEPLAQP